VPYSFVAHGSDLHRDRHMLREKVRESAFTVAISEYNRQVIVDHCGEWARDKVLVIHCGVDTSFFQPPARIAQAGPARIVCLGTLHAVKGQRELIEACARLRTGGLDFSVELIGDGPDRAALERHARALRLDDRIEFVGPLTRAEVAERLRAATLLAAPSLPTSDGRREGLPVALMEACASELPVVASRLSGIPELVEDGRTGLLVEPGDVEGLSRAIERLLRDPELRCALGRAGRERVEKEFHLDANAAALASRLVGSAS
jgi:glycosyltransferase involved in cell wall biosynthesis